MPVLILADAHYHKKSSQNKSAFWHTQLAHLCKISSVVVQLEVMEMDNVGGDGVEEISVVRHNDERLLPSLQVLLHDRKAASQYKPCLLFLDPQGSCVQLRK